GAAPPPAAEGHARARPEARAETHGRRGAGAGIGTRAAARGRHAARAPGSGDKRKNQKLLLGVGAAFLVVVAVVLVLALGGGGDKSTETAGAAAAQIPSATGESTTKPETTAEAIPTKPAEPDPAKKAPEPAAKAPEPKEPEVIDPVFNLGKLGYEPFPKLPDCTDEEWRDIQDLVNTVKTDRGKKGSRAGNKLKQTYDFKAIPAVINAFDGLNFSDGMDRANASYLARLLEGVLHKAITVGFRETPAEQDLTWNVKLMKDVARYWNERVKDPEKLAATLRLISEKAAKEAEGPGAAGEEG
ncbi:MAG: hypothetical protein AB1486_31940, partial [Planctomycetota bacterium]